MKIYYDTEFIENGHTIDLISIGMVREDGREYYAVSSDVDFAAVLKSDWLVRNVVPSLPLRNRAGLDKYLSEPKNCYPKPSLNLVELDVASTEVKPRQVIANEVRDFILTTSEPQLWAWYAAYDHVALCQLWGRMIELPDGVPMFTNDLKQECVRLGDPSVPAQEGIGEHNALEDARHNYVIAAFLADLANDAA